MNIPNLGEVRKDERFGWYYSEPISLRLLRGRQCRVVVEGYDDDGNPEDYHAAIANLLNCSFSVLRIAEEHVFKYYQDMNSNWQPTDAEFVSIDSASDVWDHIQFGGEPMVTRRAYGDKAIYVSLECNCDWEPEHGLQIVLKDGQRVCKVGPYDGHLTNSDAYADDSLEGVIYR